MFVRSFTKLILYRVTYASQVLAVILCRMRLQLRLSDGIQKEM